jgi:hypothetical protein
MNAFAAIVFASLLSRLGYQTARSLILPAFAADLGALPEFIGEAAGPIIAGFLIVGLGYASTFDTLALVTVVVSIGVVVQVRDPKTVIAGQHPSARR